MTTLYSSQVGLLNFLIAHEIYKNKDSDLANLIQKFIGAFYQHTETNSQVQHLVNAGLIDGEGFITERGRIFANVNPAFFKGRALCIRTNHFLFKCLADGVLGECFAHMNDETFLQVARLVQAELIKRNPDLVEISEETENDLVEQAKVEDEILMFQASEVVVDGEVMTVEEVVEMEEKEADLAEVTKSKRKKKTA